MSDVLFHVGWHKTGTTSVQAALKAIVRAGKQSGFYFVDRNKGAGAAVKAWLYPEWYSKEDDQDLESAALTGVRAIKGKASGRQIIWSEENFSQELESNLQHRALERLERILEILDPNTYRMHVFYRDQWDFLPSLYSTRIKNKIYAYTSISDMVDFNSLHHYPYLDWAVHASALRASFGEQAVVAHHFEIASAKGLVDYALGQFGVTAPTVTNYNNGDRSNLRLDAQTVHLLEKVSEFYKNGKLELSEAGWIKGAVIKTSQSQAQRPFALSPTNRDKVYNFFRDRNAAFTDFSMARSPALHERAATLSDTDGVARTLNDEDALLLFCRALTQQLRISDQGDVAGIEQKVKK